MKTIKMSAEQTKIYDLGSEAEQRSLMALLREQANDLAAQSGQTVEVITDDGIVADVVNA